MALQRLHKIIANAGITSRRKAETLILEGAVTVNGKRVTELGAKADPATDAIKVNGELLMFDEDNFYIVMNKPMGVVSSLSDPEGRMTLTDVLRPFNKKVVPIGRLDINSEGLLLLSNDGDLVNELSKARTLPKTYKVKIKGHYNPEMLGFLKRGIFTREGVLRFKTISLDEKLKNKTWLTLEVVEGAGLNIREILNRRELMVDRIIRTAVGSLELGTLKPGEWAQVSKEDFQRLLSEAQSADSIAASGEKVDPATIVSHFKSFREPRGYSRVGDKRRPSSGERGDRRGPRRDGERKPRRFGDVDMPRFSRGGDRPARGECSDRSFGDRPARGERGDRSFGDRPARGERGDRSFGDRPARKWSDERPSRPSREDRSERPNRGRFDDRPARKWNDERSDRAPRGERSFGDRGPRGDRGERPARRFQEDVSPRPSRSTTGRRKIVR